ncbi:MAG: hypothetical protein HPY81_09620 [Firmicutes bacterium]|nr:hypothetical protein [Bacillota bacterium]
MPYRPAARDAPRRLCHHTAPLPRHRHRTLSALLQWIAYQVSAPSSTMPPRLTPWKCMKTSTLAFDLEFLRTDCWD